jgi:hypothetical protein
MRIRRKGGNDPKANEGDQSADPAAVPPGAGGDFAALAPELTKRIDAILDGVQQEADKMLEEARSETRQKVEAETSEAEDPLAERRRRLAELSETLIERTESLVAKHEETELVRESFGRLLRALSEAADEVATEVAASASPSPEQPAPAPPAPAPPTAPATTPPPGRALVEARQAAIQMAAAGNTRTQVEAHLRDFLKIEEPTPLLDQVFGAATAGDARVPWAIAPSPPGSRPGAPESPSAAWTLYWAAIAPVGDAELPPGDPPHL